MAFVGHDHADVGQLGAAVRASQRLHTADDEVRVHLAGPRLDYADAGIRDDAVQSCACLLDEFVSVDEDHRPQSALMRSDREMGEHAAFAESRRHDTRWPVDPVGPRSLDGLDGLDLI